MALVRDCVEGSMIFYVNGSEIVKKVGLSKDPVIATRVFIGNDQDSLGGGFELRN